MNCCVQVSTENLKHLGQNVLFLHLVTQVLTRAILYVLVLPLHSPQKKKKKTDNNLE